MSENQSVSKSEQLTDFVDFYVACSQQLKDFVDSQGGKWYGLSYETLDKVGAGYFESDDGKFVILPHDENHYFNCKAGDKNDRGYTRGRYNFREVTPIKAGVGTINFILDDFIDALSCYEACGEKCFENWGLVAVGGTSTGDIFLEDLNRRYADAAVKPRFVVFADKRDVGLQNGQKIVNGLKESGYPAVLRLFERDAEGNQLDANDILLEGGDKLGCRLIEFIEDTERPLREQAEDFERAAERERLAKVYASATDLTAIDDYFSNNFFADVERTAKYAERRTGFENVDESMIFLPGLYLVGALPAAGKTTFVWQWLSQLAAAGEPCVFVSYEMSKFELFTKSVTRELFNRYGDLAQKMSWTSANLRKGAGRNSDEVKAVVGELSKAAPNLHVLEATNVSITELVERLKPIADATDQSLVVAVDYLQIVPPSESVKSTKEQVDDVVLRLKNFQRDTNATVIVISSFNRENYYNEVDFRSFKESGAIEYSADVVLGLESYVEGVKDNGKSGFDVEESKAMSRKKIRDVRLTCLKNRNGGFFKCMFTYYAAHDCFVPAGTEPKHKKPPRED